MPLDAASTPSLAPAVVPDLATVSRIYCGRRVPAQHVDATRPAEVTDHEVRCFVAEVVAKRFPDGFTVMHGQGGWTDMATGLPIREPSIVVEVMHGPAQAADVQAVAQEWKRRFRQDAVMVASVPVAVRFV